MTQPTTKLAKRLADHGDHSQAWLARKLGITRQSIGEMVNGNIACPKARQAQIAIHLELTASEYFDPETGLATRLES